MDELFLPHVRIARSLALEGMTVDDFCMEPMAKRAGLGQPGALIIHFLDVSFSTFKCSQQQREMQQTQKRTTNLDYPPLIRHQGVFAPCTWGWDSRDNARVTTDSCQTSIRHTVSRAIFFVVSFFSSANKVLFYSRTALSRISNFFFKRNFIVACCFHTSWPRPDILGLRLYTGGAYLLINKSLRARTQRFPVPTLSNFPNQGRTPRK